jgi:hypothetical protein
MSENKNDRPNCRGLLGKTESDREFIEISLAGRNVDSSVGLTKIKIHL